MEMPTIVVKHNIKHTGQKILAVVGVLAVLVGVVWVGVRGFRALPNASKTLASAFVSVQSFFTPSERIVVSVVDNQVIVDEPFTLMWEHRGKDEDGSYTLSYECRDSVHLSRMNATGNATTLFCNTEVPLLATDTTLRLIATGEVAGAVSIPVSIRFTKNNSSVISREGTVDVRIQEERFDTATSTGTASIPNGTASTSTPSKTPTTPRIPGTPTTQTISVVTGPVSDPNGKSDLTIRVIAIGLVDKNTGAFTERNEIPKDLPTNKRGAIKFEIRNDGTKKTGDDWQFAAKLPTSPAHTYTSPKQPELFPDDRVEYIIGFDRVKNADEATYEIEVDSKDVEDESKENNNTVSRKIDIDRN
ncbi:MAG: hypothetical protein AAB460_03350 [Patescibacteria group bacterium]